MVTFVNNQNIPGTAFDHSLSVLAEYGLVNARHDDPIGTQSGVGGRSSNPSPCIKIELFPKLKGDIANQARRREVQHPQRRRLIDQAFYDEAGFESFAEADL